MVGDARVGVKITGDASELVRNFEAAINTIQQRLSALQNVPQRFPGPAAISKEYEDIQQQAAGFGSFFREQGAPADFVKTFFTRVQREMKDALIGIGQERLRGYSPPALTPQRLSDLEYAGLSRNLTAGGYVVTEKNLLVPRTSAQGYAAGQGPRGGKFSGTGGFVDDGEAESAAQKHAAALNERTTLLRSIIANEEGTLDAEVQAKVANTEYRLALQKALNAIIELPNATAALAKEENIFRARLAKASLILEGGIEATAARNAAERELAIAERQATLVATQGQIGAEAALAVAEARRRVAISLQEEALVTDESIAATAAEAAAKQRNAARTEALTQAELAVSEQYLSATAASKASRARQANIIKILNAQEEALGPSVRGVGGAPSQVGAGAVPYRGALAHTAGSLALLDDAALDALATESAQVRTQHKRLAAQERLLSDEHGLLALKTQEKVNQRAINRLEQQRIIQLQTSQGLGSPFQRFQANIHARRGDPARALEDFPTLGSFIAQRTVGLAGYAVGGAALYGVVNGIQEAVQAASQFERTLAAVRGQLDSLGEGFAGRFQEFREAAIASSRIFGVSAAEIGEVQRQLIGVYSADKVNGFNKALDETNAAFRTAVITGIEQKELTDSLTAASLAFGVSIDTITDEAVDLEDEFGVLARESLKVFGDMATVATAAGLSLQELGAIIGGIQQRSALPGATISEGISRVIPTIQENYGQILQVYAANAKTAENLPKLQEFIGRGDTGKVLLQLVRDFDNLTSAQQKTIVVALGGARQARFLNALFNNTSAILSHIDKESDAAGKGLTRFGQIQETLSQRLKRVRADLAALGTGLAEAGLFDALKLVLAGLGSLIALLVGGVNTFNRFNDALGGTPAKLLAIVAVMKALAVTMKIVRDTELLSLVAGSFGRRAAGRTAAAGVAQVGFESVLLGSAAAAVPARRNRVVGAAGDEVSGLLSLLALNLGRGGGARSAETAFFGRLTKGFQGLFAKLSALLIAFGTQIQTLFPTLIARFPVLGSPGLAGLAGLGIGAAIAVAAPIAIRRYSDYSRKGREEQEITEKRGTQRYDLLREELVNDGGASQGFLSRLREEVQTALPGGRTKTDRRILLDAYKKAVTRDFQRAVEGGFLDPRDPEIKRIQKDLEKNPNSERARNEAERALSVISRTSRAQEFKQYLQSGKKVDDLLADKGIEALATIDEIKAGFQAGTVTRRDYLSTLQQQASLFAAAAEQSTDPEFQRQALQVIAEARQVAADFLNNEIQLLQTFAQASGGRASSVLPEAIDRLKAAIDAKTISPEAAAQQALSLFQLQQQGLADAIANAATSAEAYAIAQNGVAVDPVLKAAIEEAYGVVVPDILRSGIDQLRQLRNQALQSEALRFQVENYSEDPLQNANQALSEAQRKLNLQQDQFNRQQQRRAGNAIARAFGFDATDADPLVKGDDVEQARLALLQAETAARKQAESVALSYLNRLRSETEDPLEIARINYQIALMELRNAEKTGDATAINDATGRLNQEARNLRDERRKAVQAEFALAEARADGDPVLLAQVAQGRAAEARKNAVGITAIREAEAQQVQADQQARDAQRQIADSKLNLAEAQAGNNVIAQADVAQRRAAEAARRAVGEAQRIDAMAQKIAADRQMQDAIAQVQDAQINLMITMADIAGDVVGAAQLRSRQAIEALNKAIAQGAGKEVTDPLRGAVAQAEANVQDVARNEAIRQIDVALALEEITTQTALQRLTILYEQALAEKQGQQELDDLRQKIFQLTKSASQDLQFGISPEIMPTFYEARRLNQQGTYGPNAQTQVNNDNRQITITPIITNNVDAAKLVSDIEQIMVSQSRTVPGRLY